MIISPKIRPFRFWSQKVLPLVYDDSLSYYEVLCKMLEKINEIIKFVQTTLYNDIAELVNEYFVNMTYDSSSRTIYLTIGEEENE